MGVIQKKWWKHLSHLKRALNLKILDEKLGITHHYNYSCHI